LHGAVNSSGEDKIDINLLKNKNINYLALGHYHSYYCEKLDSNGVYVYSGCLEGRGFDETGEKGFVMLEIENGKIKQSFVPFALRTLHKVVVDFSQVTSLVEQENKIKQAVENISSSDLVQVEITGKISYNEHIDINHLQTVFEKQFFYFEIVKKFKA
jgi:DNA repair exonuclease SbcCD nuclease subunit